jgi:hypothetical protein
VGAGLPAQLLPLRHVEGHDRLERVPPSGDDERKAKVGAAAALEPVVIACNGVILQCKVVATFIVCLGCHIFLVPKRDTT